jgi:hypothetical protein
MISRDMWRQGNSGWIGGSYPVGRVDCVWCLFARP